MKSLLIMNISVVNLGSCGGKMKTNKKLIKHSVIFQGIGVLTFSVLALLNYFSIIDLENRWLNGVIYITFSILCVSYYAFIYYTYLLRNCLTECVILGFITVPVCAIEIIISLSIPGIHTGIVAIWTGAMLSITVHCVISYLEVLEESLFVTERKYTELIRRLKIWIDPTFVGVFLIGIALLVNPNCFVVL